MSDTPDNGNLLVIGGGPVGLAVISNLRKYDKKVAITLIEPKDYVEIAWATYRTPFDASLADKTLLPLKPWNKDHNVNHVRSTVTRLDETSAALANGETLSFTVCVICVGASSSWVGFGRGASPPTKKERLEVLKAEGERILKADSVCIVGGGISGAELCGDVMYYAKKSGREVAVTLVHSGEYLCPTDCGKGTGDVVQTKLEKMGVRVILNERAERTSTGVRLTRNSMETIEAQEVIMATGISSANKAFLDSKYLDEKGWIMVDEHFRVKGAEESLMAVGDCCDFLGDSAKEVFDNRKRIGFNVKQVLDKKLGKNNVKKLKKGTPFELAKVVTIGREDGVAQLPYGYHTQRILPAYKNHTLFIPNFRGYVSYGKYKDESKENDDA